MGNFSRDTFKKLKHYVGVRLQQGVPIVDADWNELEDIRRFELQAFLKWYVGNGVPLHNDGFRIVGPGLDNDFRIKGGDDTAEGAGRCLVDGWDVLNESDLHYSNQTLFHNAALAASWGVAPLPPLTTPAAARNDQVYLDVWEREVDAGEDSELANPAIGLETCVRRKREWVVRVAEGEAVPAPGEGHVFYPLATITRVADQAPIFPPGITDLRRTGLTVSPEQHLKQVAADAFGQSYTLDDGGQARLKVSLRDAVNALLRGGLPGTDPERVSVDRSWDEDPVAVKDRDGNVWAFWRGGRLGDGGLWCRRWDPQTGTWGNETLVSSEPSTRLEELRAVADANGDVWVFWISTSGDRLYAKRYDSARGEWIGEEQISERAFSPVACADTKGTESTKGSVWLFYLMWTAEVPFLCGNQYEPGSGWKAQFWVSTSNSLKDTPFAVEVEDGDIWVFWREAGTIQSNRYDRAVGIWVGQSQVTYDSSSHDDPCAVKGPDGQAWVFWIASFDIFYNRYVKEWRGWKGVTRLTSGDSDVSSESTPFAILGRDRSLWIFWERRRDGDTVSYKRLTKDVGWGREVQLTPPPVDALDSRPTAVEDDEGDIWTFWQRDYIVPDGRMSAEIWCRRLIPTL